MNSEIGKLNLLDVLKGALLAFLAALLTALYPLLSGGVFPTTWPELAPAVGAGVAAFIAYLLKNLFSGSSGMPFKAS